MVLSRRAQRVERRRALEYVKGYTLFNDFSLKETGHFRPPVRSKCFDSFGPLGPRVVPLDDPHDVTLRCRVNGELRQEGSTRDLVWRIPELLEAITSFITLEEDDTIATGVPPGRVDAVAGDAVTVEAVGVLELTSFIVSEAEFRRKKNPS